MKVGKPTEVINSLNLEDEMVVKDTVFLICNTNIPLTHTHTANYING